jgi:hypothetical protein
VKLLKMGVRDLLRISDARMSGTSYGACVLHVSQDGCDFDFLQTSFGPGPGEPAIF